MSFTSYKNWCKKMNLKPCAYTNLKKYLSDISFKHKVERRAYGIHE